MQVSDGPASPKDIDKWQSLTEWDKPIISLVHDRVRKKSLVEIHNSSNPLPSRTLEVQPIRVLGSTMLCVKTAIKVA